MDQLFKFLEAAFPTGLAGGGLIGVYIYFRKEHAAILEDLRKTIADLRETIKAQAAEIATLWAENRAQRAELKEYRRRDPDHHEKDAD